LYNIEGKEIKIILDDSLSPGHHRIFLDANNLSSAVYFYKIGEFRDVRKLFLVK